MDKKLQAIEQQKNRLQQLNFGKDDGEIIQIGCGILQNLAELHSQFNTEEAAAAIKQNYMGVYYHLLKSPSTAESDYFEEFCSSKNTLPFIKDLTDLHYQLATIAQQLKDKAQLEFHLRKAVDYTPSAELCQKLSQYYMDMKAYSIALTALNHYHGSFDPLIFFQTLYCQNKLCNFTEIEKSKPKIQTLIEQEDATASTLFLKWIGIDQQLVVQASKNYQRQFEGKQDFQFLGNRDKNRNLRLGYIGSNFFKHAQSNQFGHSFFKLHESSFEIYIYAINHNGEVKDEETLKKSVHSYLNINSMPNDEVVKRIRNDQIDIIVNCNGLADDRSLYEILCKRVAPIQIDYLGYPGTSGATFIDYYIGDAISTPPKEMAPLFTEKLILLPHTYQLTEHEEIYPDLPFNKLSQAESKGALYALIKKNEGLLRNAILSHIGKEAIDQMQYLFNELYRGKRPITTFALQLKWFEQWTRKNKVSAAQTATLNRGLHYSQLIQESLQGNQEAIAAIDGIYLDTLLPSKEFVKDRFIFCSLNHHVKISLKDIHCWNQILKQVQNSVLVFVLMFSKDPQVHILSAFDPEVRDRICFVSAAPKCFHMHRLRAMDCVLDSFYYGAHTSAGDAIWAQVPVITRLGESMESRVCASMLHAAGLDELIAKDTQGYIDLAVKCATDPEYYKNLRLKLKTARTSPLFDRKAYIHDLCNAYRKTWETFHSQ